MDRIEVMKSRVLTVQEVSNYLRVHPSTIYRMLKKNQLPAFRVGSDWRFTVEAIDQWRAQAEAGAVTVGEAPEAPREQRAQARK
jgi:excisionase family DNA binding protein